MGPYSQKIKQVEEDITKIMKKVNDLTGILSVMVTVNVWRWLVGVKESDTGIAIPALWDLAADKQALHQEEPLQVCLHCYGEAVILLSYIECVYACAGYIMSHGATVYWEIFEVQNF